MSTGGSLVLSNTRTSVRPISRQPPGESKGYTDVCPSTTATDPAGTRSRGRGRRGATMRASRTPQYAKPGRNPRKKARYSRPVWSPIRSSTESFDRSAVSRRSGPERRDLHFGFGESVADRVCDLWRAGRVAVHAEGIDDEREEAAVDRAHSAVLDEGERLPNGIGRIGEDRTGDRTRLQRPVGFVGAVNETLACDFHSQTTRLLDHRGSGRRDDDELVAAGCGLHPEDDVPRDRRVALTLVVQRTVGLDMRDAHAQPCCDPDHGFDLAADRVDQLVRRHVHRNTTESFAVGITGMRADRDLVAYRQLDRGAHCVLVAGVPTTRDVRTTDQRHERHLGAGALSKVRIEVD